MLLVVLLWSLVEVHSQTVPSPNASSGAKAFPYNSHVDLTPWPVGKRSSGSAGVYLSLNGIVIPDHGYVVISDIGTVGDDTALLCITNRPPPTGSSNSGGLWFDPDGTEIAGNAVPGFRRNRDPMVVRLYRNTATGPPAEGIYYCFIHDDTDTVQTVHVGLYNNGGGDTLFVYWTMRFMYAFQEPSRYPAV